MRVVSDTTPFLVQVGRHAGWEITFEADADTVESACNIALARAQDQFIGWTPMRPYGPLFVTGVADPSEDGGRLPVPPGCRAPAAGLVHQEICAVIAALSFLAKYIDAPEARPFDRYLSGNGTVEPLDAAAIGALADRFID